MRRRESSKREKSLKPGRAAECQPGPRNSAARRNESPACRVEQRRLPSQRHPMNRVHLNFTPRRATSRVARIRQVPVQGARRRHRHQRNCPTYTRTLIKPSLSCFRETLPSRRRSGPHLLAMLIRSLASSSLSPRPRRSSSSHSWISWAVRPPIKLRKQTQARSGWSTGRCRHPAKHQRLRSMPRSIQPQLPRLVRPSRPHEARRQVLPGRPKSFNSARSTISRRRR